VTRRVALIGAAVVLVLGGLVVVGRWERSSRAEEQSRGMERLVTEVGPLDNPSLTAFRYFSNFQCLAYRRRPVRLALELCVDWDGRVVEAIDRRSGSPRIWSLRDDRTRSSVRVDRCVTDKLLVRMGVPRGYIASSACAHG
jgi:hypothetical protein